MRTPTLHLTIVIAFFAICLALTGGYVAAQPPTVTPVAEPPAAEEQQSQEVKDAIELFKRGKITETMAKLEEAVQKDPKLPPARIMLYRLFQGARQETGMRLSLEMAVLETPNDPEAFIALGGFALAGGRITDASLLFNHAADLMTTFQGNAERKAALQPQIHAGLASVAGTRARMVPRAERDAMLTVARGHLEAWEQADPTSADAKWQLGNTLFQLREPTLALEKLKQAKEANPAIRHWATQMAVLYYTHDPQDEGSAKEWINYALQVDKDSLDTQLAAVQLFLDMGDLDKAKEHASTAIQQDQDSMPAKILRGMISMHQQDYVTAERYFDSAHQQSPSSFEASNNLALALCEQDDPKQQRRALEFAGTNYQLHQRGQNAATAASTLGWVYYKLGQLQNAAQMLRTALQGGSRSADTLYFIARVIVDLNPEQNKAEAVQFLDAALSSKRPFWKKQDAEDLLRRLRL